ncbi:hypothetical protein C8Q80DRAFT_327239 [Daedaleopsis nitida]|nr:hypothetical protein C8Q80DRAFT_327239 [Daedaleopsis nitida]
MLARCHSVKPDGMYRLGLRDPRRSSITARSNSASARRPSGELICGCAMPKHSAEGALCSLDAFTDFDREPEHRLAGRTHQHRGRRAALLTPGDTLSRDRPAPVHEPRARCPPREHESAWSSGSPRTPRSPSASLFARSRIQSGSTLRRWRSMSVVTCGCATRGRDLRRRVETAAELGDVDVQEDVAGRRIRVRRTSSPAVKSGVPEEAAGTSCRSFYPRFGLN